MTFSLNLIEGQIRGQRHLLFAVVLEDYFCVFLDDQGVEFGFDLLMKIELVFHIEIAAVSTV